MVEYKKKRMKTLDNSIRYYYIAIYANGKTKQISKNVYEKHIRKSKKIKKSQKNQQGGDKLSDDTVEKLIVLYKKYCSDQKNIYIKNSCEYKFSTSEFNKTLLKNLDLDFPIEYIETIYYYFGIIPLRNPLSSQSLLLGCGNNPLTATSNLSNKEQHDHSYCVTVDPYILSNPTIIGAIPYNSGVIDYIYSLSMGKHKYNRLFGEGVSIAMKPYNNWIQENISNGTYNREYFECNLSKIFEDKFEVYEARTTRSKGTSYEYHGTGIDGVKKVFFFEQK